MYIGHVDKVKQEDVPYEGVKGSKLQWLLGEKENVPHFYMRYVTVEPRGVVPLHSHEMIHEMYIVRGRGAVLHEGGETPFGAGNFIYMPSGEVHGTKNTGDEPLEFVCCINRIE